MATWEDGPEYAPTARPDAFVTPDAAPLAPPPAEASVADPLPGTPSPDYAPLPPDAVPLDSVEPPRPAARDPRDPFAVETTFATSTTALATGPVPSSQEPSPTWAPPTGQPVSAWGSAHSSQVRAAQPAWAPEQPFQPNPAPLMDLPAPASSWPPPQVNPSGFPPAQPPGWIDQRMAQPPGPLPLSQVTLAQMARAATPGVLICLLIAGVVSPLALPLVAVASTLATRVRHRRRIVGLVFRVAISLCLALGLGTAWMSMQSLDVFLVWDHVNAWAQFAAWGLAAMVMLVQGDALRHNEPPDTLG